MGKGRKAIPNKIIELRGGSDHTHRPSRIDPDLPAEVPSCPPHLDDEAQKEWKRVVNILKTINLITKLDRSILAAYCEAYSRWVDATNKVHIEGTVVMKMGIPTVNPWARVANEAFDRMIKTGTLFGMSPSARASLSISSQKTTKAADKTELFRRMKNGK